MASAETPALRRAPELQDTSDPQISGIEYADRWFHTSTRIEAGNYTACTTSERQVRSGIFQSFRQRNGR